MRKTRLALPVIPRNFHRRRELFVNADALVVSIPKSGRTWLRFALRHYLCETAGIPFSIDPGATEPATIPRLLFTHDLWEHVTAPRMRDRLYGKYLIPPRVRRTRKVIVAVRDLRDVMVSLHLQLTRRGFHSGASYQGTVGEMIRDRRFGAERAVAIINAWLDEWRGTGRLFVVGYEECKKDPFAVMQDVLCFLGLMHVDARRLERAVEFSSFDNMKTMERENRFGRQLLRPGDPNDPESFKVRRGVVGGWVDYLPDDDARVVEQAAAKLRL